MTESPVRAWFTVLLLAACAASPKASIERVPAIKNVLFIAVDDLRPELGCYGVPHALSPHIDAFAATGMVFENHFVQAPSCGPSRYALLTGRSPDASGALGNNALFAGQARLRDDPALAAQTLPEVFRRSGRRTVCIGKISHTPDGRVFAYDGSGDGRDELPGAWDEKLTPFGPWERGWGAFFAYANGEHREDGQGHDDLMQFEAERDTDLPDGLIAERAAARLAEFGASDEPFFMGVGFYKPHLPFVAPKADRDAVAALDVPLPPMPNKPRLPSVHGSGEFKRYTSTFGEKLPDTPEEAIEVRRAYLACVRYVDRQIGLVLDALEDAGLADSTAVVLWGDHGWHLGDSGVWGKHTLLDRSLHSPLIVRAPGVTQPGSRSAALAASIDVFPTLLDLADLAGTETAHPLDGESLRGLLDGTAESVRDDTRAWYGGASTVRTRENRVVTASSGKAYSFDVADGPDPIGTGLPPKERPNVLLILADDLGYGDLGFTGCTDFPTPHLDRLAREGVVCTDGHVSASVCAPSRAGLLTGRYQQRSGFDANLAQTNGLLPGTRTFAHNLQRAGYRTALVGKWHLGPDEHNHPTALGFDHFMGLLAGSRSYFPLTEKAPGRTRRIERDGEHVGEASLTYLTDDFTDEGVRLIEERDAGTPFFLWMSYTAPHGPMHARPDLAQRFASIEDPRRRKYAAMVTALDEGVGRLLGTLDSEGIAETTLVVFLSDNGGATNNGSDNGAWRGMKGSKWEGGHRVPFVVRWPGRLAPGHYDAAVSSLDLASTFLRAADAAPLNLADGVDLLPYFTEAAAGQPHPQLFWRRGAAAAAREGAWKLIRVTEADGSERPPILVNLNDDPSELSDRAGAEPERVERLMTLLRSWESALVPPRWTTGEVWRQNQRRKHEIDVVGRAAERKLP